MTNVGRGLKMKKAIAFKHEVGSEPAILEFMRRGNGPLIKEYLDSWEYKEDISFVEFCRRKYLDD